MIFSPCWSAGKGNSAEHQCSNYVHLQALAGGSAHASGPRHQDERRNAYRNAADEVSDHPGPGHVDPRLLCCQRVAADGLVGLSDPALLEQQVAYDKRDYQQGDFQRPVVIVVDVARDTANKPIAIVNTKLIINTLNFISAS